jgi:hypothetical protein
MMLYPYLAHQSRPGSLHVRILKDGTVLAEVLWREQHVLGVSRESGEVPGTQASTWVILDGVFAGRVFCFYLTNTLMGY